MKNHEIEKNYEIAYEKAKKRLEEQKAFYYHLSVYIVISITLFFLKGDYIIFSSDIDPETREMIKDVFEKILSVIPIFWGIGLLIHGILIFIKSFFLNTNWEKRRIEKHLNKNNQYS